MRRELIHQGIFAGSTLSAVWPTKLSVPSWVGKLVVVLTTKIKLLQSA